MKAPEVASSPGACPSGILRLVSRDGLTRREIGWLLAQEARRAAQALRRGIEIKVRESLPQDEEGRMPGESAFGAPMLDGLAALDDAIGMLGELHVRSGLKRRGRIDVAALLYELAPTATIAISAEGGTEVFGEEDELSRMLQMLLADAGSGRTPSESTPQISVERLGQEVHIMTELGPDAAPLDGLERRWLNRMATRAGGRLEVSGRAQTLILPADGIIKEAEMKALRQELAEAQELGEAFARELATVLTSAAGHAGNHESDATEHWTDLISLAPALASSLERAGDTGSALRQAVEAIAGFRASELNAPFDVAEVLTPLSRDLAVDLHALPGQRAFDGAPGTVGLLGRLLLLCAQEQAPPGEVPTMTFVVRESELELSVTFLAPATLDPKQRPQGFAWAAGRALARQSGGSAQSSSEPCEQGRRVLLWARIPERSLSSSHPSARPGSWRPD